MGIIDLKEVRGLLVEGSLWVNVLATLVVVALIFYLLAPFLHGVAAIINASTRNRDRSREVFSEVLRREVARKLAEDREAVHAQKLKKPRQGPRARKEDR